MLWRICKQKCIITPSCHHSDFGDAIDDMSYWSLFANWSFLTDKFENPPWSRMTFFKAEFRVISKHSFCSLNCHFWGKFIKMMTRVFFLDFYEFTLYMIFGNFHGNSHNLSEWREKAKIICRVNSWKIRESTLVIFVIFLKKWQILLQKSNFVISRNLAYLFWKNGILRWKIKAIFEIFYDITFLSRRYLW